MKTEHKAPEMSGIFKELAENFISFKRNLGFKYQSEEKVMSRFCRFSNDYDLTEVCITKKLAEDWIAPRAGETGKSRAHRLTCVRQFGEYLYTLGYSVLLTLMYDTGCRVQELVDLRVCDITLADTVTVKLTGKGDKSRIVPVMAPTGQLIRQYIAENHLDTALYRNHPLFTNRSGKKMTRAGITYILQKYAEQAYLSGHEDVDPKLTPHCLRHSKAMHLLQSGINLIYIRDLLGHSDVSTTEVYARADEKMKREALENAYQSPSDGEMPSWQEDNDLLNWLKNFGK